MSGRVTAELLAEMAEAEEKAWDSLARYKFVMFGYWAGLWVHLNRIGHFRRPNPFFRLVTFARERRASAAAPAPDVALFDEEAA